MVLTTVAGHLATPGEEDEVRGPVPLLDHVEVGIPSQIGHRFRRKSATHSGANRPLIPM
jgi:hypothetical protein